MVQGPVLVVGGSRGIGRVVVERLAAEGLRVAFTWRAAEAAASELAERTRAKPFPFDLRDRTRAAALVEEIEAVVGPLAGLVNNAAARRDQLLAATSDDDWEDVVDANLGGVFRVCRAVLPGMLRRRAGAIVNVASLSAYRGLAGQAAYAASKAGILALTRVLARECGRRRVRVNAVVPGFVATDFVSDVPEEAVAALRTSECLPGGTSPADVADAIRFLLSDGASAITGQAIVVDSGASA
jgi:3-oxoacyl-[acyl-carrier protein] reductase